MPGGPGLVGVVVALVGTTAYDGRSRTSWWQRSMPTGIPTATLGWVCSMVLIALVFLLGALSLAGVGPRPGVFAHALVPIAAGYAIAH
jgi:hypothetical protein